MDDQNELTSWFGVIKITAIKNGFTKSDFESIAGDIIYNLEENHVKFIHYPDCQQLIIWLPEYGRNYDEIVIKNINTDEIIFDKKVPDILNGSIQLLLDTLPFPPGFFEIKINKMNGFCHLISFTKFEESILIKEPEVEVPKYKYSPEPPIIYKDGNGKIIPDEDLILRDKIITKMVNRFTRKIEYTGNVRSGSVIYIEGDKRLEFYSEMGGGNCIFYVDIPSCDNWEKSTGYPLEERDEIIKFIAETTHRDQAPSGYYTIKEEEIVYYSY